MPRERLCPKSRASALFRKVLSRESLDALARTTRFVRRKRQVTGSSVVWSLLLTLGAHPTEYISDVLRTLNAQEDWSLRYKPFWNRLAQPCFPALMRELFRRLCSELAIRVLEREAGSVSARFSHILIDDGSSFAVAQGLQRTFPGRFTTKTPAAVELHAHMDLLSGNLLTVALAPDKEAERQFLPSPKALPKGSLSLRDRGYVDVGYFAQLEGRDAYVICRAKRDINPVIVKVLAGLPPVAAKRIESKKLKEVRFGPLKSDLDLLVAFKRGAGVVELRLIIPCIPRKRIRSTKRLRLPFKKKRRFEPTKPSCTWFLTNVNRDISAQAVSSLYRLRWQIELVFKDWKSHANLHAFQSQEPSIVEGLIWTSLCAAFIKRALAHWTQRLTRKPISTRLVAIAGPQIFPLVIAWAASGFQRARLQMLLDFIASNAQPTHPERLARAPARFLGLRPNLRAA